MPFFNYMISDITLLVPWFLLLQNGTDKAEEKYLCKETGVEAPNPWPECKKLPCVCLGDRGLSVEHANLILNGEASKEPSCGSTTNYLKFKDTQGSPYIIPKQTNCGTYKVHSPDLENACECPSAGKRELLPPFFHVQAMFTHTYISCFVFSGQFLEWNHHYWPWHVDLEWQLGWRHLISISVSQNSSEYLLVHWPQIPHLLSSWI